MERTDERAVIKNAPLRIGISWGDISACRSDLYEEPNITGAAPRRLDAMTLRKRRMLAQPSARVQLV